MGKKYPESEREVIATMYPKVGAAGVRQILPHLSRATIAARAKDMGVRFRAPYKTVAQRALEADMRSAGEIPEDDTADDTVQLYRTQDNWIKHCRPVVPRPAICWVFDLAKGIA